MANINDSYFAEDSSVTLKNPTKEDFLWKKDSKPYRLAAGETRIFQGGVANLCVKHFVDKMMNDASIEDPKVATKMGDMLSRQEYADRIIVREDKSYDEPVEEEIGIDEGAPVRELPEEDLTEDKPVDVDTLPKDEDLYPAPKKDKKASNLVDAS